MGASESAAKEKSPKCTCGHTTVMHVGQKNRGKCLGYVRLRIIPRDAVPVRDRLDSDVWLSHGDAKDLLSSGQKKVEKMPSYEKQFRKGLARGFFLIECDCTSRSSLEKPDVEMYHP